LYRLGALQRILSIAGATKLVEVLPPTRGMRYGCIDGLSRGVVHPRRRQPDELFTSGNTRRLDSHGLDRATARGGRAADDLY
jgi:hypothetical protein